MQEAAAPCIILGELDTHKTPVFSPNGCLPNSVGALIAMDRGVRRVQKEELAKAKGVPDEWMRQGKWMGRSVTHLTDIHLWTAMAASLHGGERERTNPDLGIKPGLPPTEGKDDGCAPTDGNDDRWDWVAPDLSEGSAWHTARIENLRRAVIGLPDADTVLADGLKALEIHRQNYDDSGTIHRLQLLWWEFPPEHWDALRNGCHMNFLTEPKEGIIQNAPMTDEQVTIAAEFIDKLWAIGVFERIPDNYEMKANCPLFAVAKPGQPGQWRIIADMKNGGQNAHIGKDPVHLPRAKGILEKLYTGGWSAIIDASKVFPQFSNPCQ
jgi:hypothetical protein